MFEISTLEFVENEFLTNTVNFDIGSTFSKRRGTAFSQVRGQVPGPLYKLCRMI